MAFNDLTAKLDDSEFALYFSGGDGVSAESLGDLLRRAAIVARRAGAELQITAIEPGSLAVVMRTLKKSGAAVGNEFKGSPVQTSAATAALVTLVVGALAQTMSPESGEAKPLARAAAEIVERGDAERIEIITRKSTILVMDADRAGHIRENDRRKKHSRILDASTVGALMESARMGTLTGTVLDVEGELHFRPDGFRYLVPIDLRRSDGAQMLYPGLHTRVSAELTTLHGQPDTMLIHQSMPI